MTGMAALRAHEHMTEDEMGLHNMQLYTDIALLQHQHAHATRAGAISAEWCDACGIEIPEARRQALPGVMCCVDCAREEEMKQRMTR